MHPELFAERDRLRAQEAELERTIDTHAVAATLLLCCPARTTRSSTISGIRRRASRRPARAPRPASPAPNPFYADAYHAAAARPGILPRELQSITWEAVRGLFEGKKEALKSDVEAIWNKHLSGTILAIKRAGKSCKPPAPEKCHPHPGTDEKLTGLEQIMKRHNIPLTRENYLELAYLGQVLEDLGEEEGYLPEKFRR